MKQTNFVAYEQNVIMYFFLTLNQCFDEMALLAWWSAPEAKLVTKCQQHNHIIEFKLHFVHMQQNLPVSSNFEVIIMFSRRFTINPWVHDEYFACIKFRCYN